MFTTIITFILVLGLLVLIHELGHFLVAKKMGMKVEEFGFGFPPKLWGWRNKKSGTLYSINWIPLGGFVRIKGESGDFKNESDSFASKSVWRRFLVLVAGVTMNLILASVLLSVGYMAGLPSAINQDTPVQAIVESEQIRIMQVMDNSPASEAGIQGGDVLMAIDQHTFETAEDVSLYLKENAENGVDLILKNKMVINMISMFFLVLFLKQI